MSNYVVYMHTVPNGKVYIGITKHNPPERRWGKGGRRYKNNVSFWKDIQKYGWSNIKHDILYSDIPVDLARQKERMLISSYDSMNPLYGYNHTSGGDVSTQEFSAEVIESIRQHSKSMWQNPQMRNHIISKMVGHEVSDVTRQKISLKNKGRKLGHPSPLLGRHLSVEHITKLKMQVPWNKGLTMYDDERLMQSALKLRGRIHSTEHSKNISIGRKRKFQDGYSPVWVTDGITETLADSVELNNYMSLGYKVGRLNDKSIYVTDGVQTKKISENELPHYESLGWHRGKDVRSTKNIAKSHLQYLYTFDSCQFTSCKDILAYLQLHGYPTISLGSVIKLAAGGYVAKYADLVGAIVREHL